MNLHRGRCVVPESPLRNPSPEVKPKLNRLSRRVRQSPTPAADIASPHGHTSEFKTPTRIPKSRAAFSGESPHNDSDFQQDIIWDSTSPSPRRLGKRGKKHAAGAVDISEIVSRIAPKHGRPKVAEPTLQQWIGDSAAIPCTPDVQVPKPKKKSPRANGVDDLLKLAKQFDFNMFRQDVGGEEDAGDDQSMELLSENISPQSRPTDGPLAEDTAGTEDHVDDDLDFLFDRSTQHVSRALSQLSSGQPAAKEHSRQNLTNSRGTSVKDEFEDSWDDLLNDSLVMEMTQNPPCFSSTQKLSGDRKHPPPVGPSSSSEMLSQRWTFRLDTKPIRSVSAASSRTPSDAVGPVDPPPAVSDFLDDDLDSLFASEPAWDDLADEDLCEMCDHLEKQMQNVSSNEPPAAQTSTHPPAPPPSSSSWNSLRQRPANHQPLPLGGGGAYLQPLSQRHTPSALTCSSGSFVQVNAGVTAHVSSTTPAPTKKQFTFKKPHNLVSMVTNPAHSKCSAAEIELKKQQAMERRRQRLQTVSNL